MVATLSTRYLGRSLEHGRNKGGGYRYGTPIMTSLRRALGEYIGEYMGVYLGVHSGVYVGGAIECF